MCRQLADCTVIESVLASCVSELTETVQSSECEQVEEPTETVVRKSDTIAFTNSSSATAMRINPFT